MCGISGFIPSHQIPGDHLANIVHNMNAPLNHRGPDDEGIFIDERGDIGLAHKRLSIIDLSACGHQPMVSSSGRYVIVYNGEIYNFQELRQMLINRGAEFKGSSDTEVLLEACEEFGPKQALDHVNGMFSFAVYDKYKKRLFCARDRLGKKPLYLGWTENGFAFASELKSFIAIAPAGIKIDEHAARLYMQWRYIPDPHCIYKNVWKLPPGCYFDFPVEDLSRPFDISRKFLQYWHFEAQLLRSPEPLSFDVALDRLDKKLTRAVTQRMIADVSIGAFLSGGVDSSLISALMQKNATGKISTFTVAFDNPAFNEAEFARQIANHIGSDHHEVVVTENDALDVLPGLPRIYDEPFGDPSAIPTYFVCQKARQTMKVALSGDGGDEGFGGYGWYHRARRLRQCPKSLRNLAGHLLGIFAGSPQLQKFARLASAEDDYRLYEELHSYIRAFDPDFEIASPAVIEDLRQGLGSRSSSEALMAFDLKLFLAGDVLCKVDRASMANSLEIRSPLLDKEVMEFAWTLPPGYRQDKKLLKELLFRYVPQELVDRPKQGFSVPHGQWLRGPLRDWAQTMLQPDLIGPETGISHQKIKQIWDLHKTAKQDWGHFLWTLCQYGSWKKEWQK